uniref:uncharacterized protein LOC122591751 n=1 Tax=Erigeron canadensis TaxID=72917 RepID=UPI001CB9BE1F|nr:uncharacterized protein LOC122591751 [Erigeron canadensis]
MVTAPKAGETLQMYLAASEETISAVLVANRKEGQQPIYYVSRVLQGPEVRYPEIEKLALALIHAARRLRRYFQAHPIEVLTDKPIRQVLTKPEVSGRLAKWAIELGEHEVEFRPRNSVKGQILADFLAETPPQRCGEKRKMLPQAKKAEVGREEQHQETWKLFTDGASSADGSGAGLILTNPVGQEFTYALRVEFKASNNVAEYEALLAGLRIAKEMKVEHLNACVDSQIVAFQVDGTYEAKEPIMKNKLASTSFAHLTKEVLVETLAKSSIEAEVLTAAIEEEGDTWMSPIVEYLTSGILPEDRDQARKIRVKAPHYVLREEGLYRKSYMGPLLRCIGPRQAVKVIREIHHGACGLHSGARMVVAKIITMGYYWPSMHRDTVAEIQKCDSCQIHAATPKAPKNELIPVTSAWPFSKLGIDIVGPFPPASGKVKFLVVAIDYFTKWVEAKPLATISGKNMEKFVWEQIITRFGIPKTIVSDNGKQFCQGVFPTFCRNLEIQQCFTSVAHPQANGQVEVTNKQIVHGIKTRLGRSQIGSVEKLHQVL